MKGDVRAPAPSLLRSRGAASDLKQPALSFETCDRNAKEPEAAAEPVTHQERTCSFLRGPFNHISFNLGGQRSQACVTSWDDGHADRGQQSRCIRMAPQTRCFFRRGRMGSSSSRLTVAWPVLGGGPPPEASSPGRGGRQSEAHGLAFPPVPADARMHAYPLRGTIPIYDAG